MGNSFIVLKRNPIKKRKPRAVMPKAKKKKVARKAPAKRKIIRAKRNPVKRAPRKVTRKWMIAAKTKVGTLIGYYVGDGKWAKSKAVGFKFPSAAAALRRGRELIAARDIPKNAHALFPAHANSVISK